jgi:peptidoglycan-associated lipoprotein
MSCRHPIHPVASAVAVLLLLGGCGGAKVQANAPTPAPTPAIGATSMQAPSPPNTPTASNVNISPEILRDCDIPDANAYFGFDSAHLTAFDHTPLDDLAMCFVHGPMSGHKLRLIGHADPRGPTDYNMTLGQSRADAVRSYLASQGLSGSKATTTSRGAMDATGHDETGWAHDRRVDVYLDE